MFVLLFFLSTITRNWLVKNSEKLIGRKLEIGEMHFNIIDLLTVSQGVPATSVNVATADLENLPKELRVPQFKVEVSVK